VRLWWIRFLNRIGWRKDTLVCISKADTWRWSSHLGKQTEGKCSKCNAALYYEKQNEFFGNKVCNRCNGQRIDPSLLEILKQFHEFN
jgi:hypothetical protein